MNDLETETRKYSRMWRREQYHRRSPGLECAPLAWRALDMRKGATLCDYGAGLGGAMDWYASRGMIVSGIDLCPQRADIRKACLWDLPDDIPVTDFAVCNDVLEHLPPDRVRTAVSGIRARTRIGAFVSIATISDKRHGVGELHLTIQPVEWWAALLRTYFSDVSVLPGVPDWRWHLRVKP